MEKRDSWLKVRISLEEKAAWQAEADALGLTMANLVRARMGGVAQVDRAPKPPPRASRRADPVLLHAVGRVGSNLNQLARWANTHKSEAEAVLVLEALIAIDSQLRASLSYRSGSPQGETGSPNLGGDKK